MIIQSITLYKEEKKKEVNLWKPQQISKEEIEILKEKATKLNYTPGTILYHKSITLHKLEICYIETDPSKIYQSYNEPALIKCKTIAENFKHTQTAVFGYSIKELISNYSHTPIESTENEQIIYQEN